jgi:hypothetical protein
VLQNHSTGRLFCPLVPSVIWISLNLSDLSGSSATELGIAISLGISGLPEPTSDMVSGGLYVLSVRTSSTRFPLLSSSLQNALNAGLRCIIVTASEPADLLVRLDTPNGFSSATYLTVSL